MFLSKFWKQALERAVKTAAQAVVASGLISTTVPLDWRAVTGIGLTSALLSILTSIGSTRVGDDSPSLTS